jgi:amino acid transporter
MLINYIMGSRLLYGMARQGLLPAILGRIHGRYRTPYVAILTLLLSVLILAVSGGPDAVRTLASATALLLIVAFIVVNLALIALKLRPAEPRGAFEVPIFIPIVGVVINATLVTARLAAPDVGYRAPCIAAVIIAAITCLYFIFRPKSITEEALAAAEGEA